MKVGFHSPLPPQRSGVADYSAALLTALRGFGEVEAYAARGDAHLYHLGNNRLHRDIYRRALAHPGVVVMHDAVLQHFFLGALDEGAYVEEFVYNYGEWNRDHARDLWRGRENSGSAAVYFQYPMLRRIAEVSRAIVVHNPAAARMVREHFAEARVVEIPHLFAPPALPAETHVMRFRGRVGIPACAPVFGVFGYLRESKRVLPILRAFAEARRAAPEARLLIAGQFVSRDLARAAAPLLAAAGIVRLPYLPERDFWLAASASDAAICLRYPAAGETSGIAIRFMGIGRTVLLSDSMENCRFPETACIRIPNGLAEQAALSEHITWLSSLPAAAAGIGRRGADHVARHHAPERVSELYWKTLCECRD